MVDLVQALADLSWPGAFALAALALAAAYAIGEWLRLFRS